ncbi:NifU family SUF system FeS assembly protein [Ameyamaea chiangmaiensis NBRC 103196]|uniref:Iron-sulfur cluster assembly scaffold protein n=1 Tax=Ameyamaea chiangmaiensis TaxID=442969 RepID=A0A850PFD3_9PROT|nr:iron-sulfur cluster assembly scaffold protein [Ameyamaea chiangmaiensis]MBS4074524.1 iron-sulfur cluster assembly scaffold protein [Ameyamaea chiangmaiensis]NVN41160.1 iron-sulfur cluster assembly scaffold protein [Ameyamaea chiangmaiensis]GBQ72364.1 NifU family SUF system FeS assembly protein [Ameyamaea chiangmaiensis NBRC 103196]
MNDLGHDLYHQTLMARSRAPRFAGVADAATGVGEGRNPMCGDRVRVSLRCVEGRLTEVRHETRGCAICQASADLMAEALSGAARDDVAALTSEFEEVVTVEGATTVRFMMFRPLVRQKSRRRCATLPWSALAEALAEQGVKTDG